jgi:hypothetical protein
VHDGCDGPDTGALIVHESVALAELEPLYTLTVKAWVVADRFE